MRTIRASVGLWGALLAFPGGAADAPPFWLRDVRLVTLTDAEPAAAMTVAIAGGQIRAIGPESSLRVPEGAAVVDGGGRYLLPGLIEMHVHLRYRFHLDLLLGHGVTTVRNMDGTPEILSWRDAIASGETIGPTLLSASPFLHRHARDMPQRYVGSVDDARRLVRKYAATGYDYIKIAELDDDPYDALMDEAARIGIPVVGHIPNYDRPLEQVFGRRMASIEHVEELFRVYFDYSPDVARIPDFVQLVRRSGVPISALIRSEVVKNGLFAELGGYLTPERLAWVERYNGSAGVERVRGTVETIAKGDWPREHVDIDFVLRLVAALHEAGVVVVPGTDSGGAFVIPGIGLHEEMALFEQAGLSRDAVLKAATIDSARVLGLESRKGTVEVGKDADLILVDGDPRGDLAVLRRPAGIVVGGRWIDALEAERLRDRTFADAGG